MSLSDLPTIERGGEAFKTAIEMLHKDIKASIIEGLSVQIDGKMAIQHEQKSIHPRCTISIIYLPTYPLKPSPSICSPSKGIIAGQH